MLNVLLESKAARSRRVGGTVMSTLVHAAVIAGAIALTVPKPSVAHDAPKQVETIFIAHPRPTPPRPAAPQPPRPEQTTVSPPAPGPVLQFNGPDVPVIRELVPSTTTTTPEEFGTGIQTGGPIGPPTGIGSPDGVVEERFVERSPRLVNAATQPTFPPSLRQSGRGGRVLVQFVVDTTGRAEMDGFKVIETTDPLFAESVRSVLPRYRFSAGEAAGRKVRTLVQLPFDFTLIR